MGEEMTSEPDSKDFQLTAKLIDALRGVASMHIAIGRLADSIDKLNETLRAGQQIAPPNSPPGRS